MGTAFDTKIDHTKTTDLAEFAKARNVRYFMVTYTDLLGYQRAKLVPTRAISGMQKDGAGFAGFAGGMDMTPAHSDMLAVPDPASVIQLPWNPEVAWVASNCVMDGRSVDQAPRNTLKRLVEEAASVGIRVKTGVEPEFSLTSMDGKRVADEHDNSAKPCYDQQALMRRYDIIAEVSDAMLGLGWEPYQNDHEDANGQFEMNWVFDDVMVTADRYSFFKFMMKTIAEKHGVRATFMPKPFPTLTGNGCHAHISAWDLDGKKNIFADDSSPDGLSESGMHFLGGIMRYAPSMTAIICPTVNSYKRINAPRTVSGSTWAPNAVTWTGNNRTHMVRVPGPGRFELRLPDGAANPYLMQAVILAAGLRGLREKMDPGPRSDINMYTDGHTVKNAPRLPLNLLDALRLLDEDTEFKEALGVEMVDGFVKMKMREWNSYTSHLTQWELDNTLDC